MSPFAGGSGGGDGQVPVPSAPGTSFSTPPTQNPFTVGLLAAAGPDVTATGYTQQQAQGVQVTACAPECVKVWGLVSTTSMVPHASVCSLFVLLTDACAVLHALYTHRRTHIRRNKHTYPHLHTLSCTHCTRAQAYQSQPSYNQQDYSKGADAGVPAAVAAVAGYQAVHAYQKQ